MDAPDDVPSFDVTPKRAAGYATAILVAGVVVLPTVHGALYDLLFATPSVLQWGLVSLVVGALGVRRDDPRLRGLALAIFVVLGLFVGPIVGGVYAHTDMANQMQSDAERVDRLPNTSTENVRVLPRSVSDNYAQSSMQYPQYRLTESDITYRNGTYQWSHGLVPDNFLVSWFGNQNGAMYVDMTTTDKRVAVEETEFANGRGQLFFDSYKYRSVLHAPLKQHNWDTTFNARVDGESYIAHSTTTYQWKFRLGPLPQLYAVPQHGSVEVMRPDGSISSLSPSAAAESELLRGQNVYPYHLAMFKVESMQYVNGALNKWFWKEDVLAIADLPESGNGWPITVPTGSEADPELTYFVATEPTGSGNGVYEVWLFDGQTGEAAVQQYDDSQLGPRKAVDFVERRQEVNRLSSAQAISPVPVVKDGTLFWHVKVVSSSRSGVVYTAFVNAESGDVTLVENTAPIYAFLTQSEVDAVQDRSEDEQAEGMTVTVVVTDGDGNIVSTENVTVPEGGELTVRVADESGNDSTNESESSGNETASADSRTAPNAREPVPGAREPPADASYPAPGASEPAPGRSVASAARVR